MRILLTGKSGQLGWELARTLAPLGELFAFDRSGFDLSNHDAMVRTVRALRPQLIVNAAAYTAVDRAETEADAAHAVNAVAPGILAGEARTLGAALIHYSTDYVFDGRKDGEYVETDVANPLSAYGRSKLAGEQAIAASGVAHIVFRTSWLYASRGKNFLLTMLRLAREKPELRVVADQFGSPTWARSIAEASAGIIQSCGRSVETMVDNMRERRGVYHLCAGGGTSWHGFAEAILRNAGIATPVRAIATAEYPLAAPRPANSMLSSKKISRVFGVVLPWWETSVIDCINEMPERSELR